MFTQPGREADRTKFLGNIALALNSMRTTPDQGLAVALTEQIKDANEQKAKGAFGSLTKEKIAFAGQIRDDLRVNLKDNTADKTLWTVVTVWRNGSSKAPTSEDGSNIIVDEIMLSFL